MTNRSLPHNPAAILADVEAYIDTLPEKRRRKRTRAEIDADYDTTPESEGENYAPPAPPPHVVSLDEDALTELVCSCSGWAGQRSRRWRRPSRRRSSICLTWNWKATRQRPKEAQPCQQN